MNSNETNGVKVEKTDTGILIELSGDIYLKIGAKIQAGEITKQFYHQLKRFIREITELAE